MALSAKYAELARLQAENECALFARRNVVGVAIGQEVLRGNDHPELCLTVFVSEKLPAADLSEEDLIPRAFGRYRTDVVSSGVWYSAALPVPPQQEISGPPLLPPMPPGALTERIRPAPGGYSVGNAALGVGNHKYAGTIGALVFDSQGCYLLSNNHVLAVLNAAHEGSPILQPGPGDGGQVPADTIGYLSRYVRLNFDGSSNMVDAALATVPSGELSPEIYGIGKLQGTAEAELGMKVQKTGRTSGHTTGEVRGLNFTFFANYMDGKKALFSQQILTTPMDQLGDSGSLLCTLDGKAVGLLLASCSTPHYHTVYSPIQSVEQLLGVSVIPPTLT